MRIPIREIVFVTEPTTSIGSIRAIMITSVVLVVLFYLALKVHPAMADSSTLPGMDASSQMESAGTLLRFIDTGIFKWGARLLAGLCIFGSAWSLKEGRYGPAVISVISAILFGTAPTWVKNIFAVGGSDSVFSANEVRVRTKTAVLVPAKTLSSREVENA